MNCSQPKNILYFEDINSIPKSIWNELGCTNNYYFHPNFLAALEKNNTHISFFYVVLQDKDEKAIAFTTVQVIDFFINEIEKNLENILKKVAHFARKLKILPKEKPLKILISGNSFVSGEHGVFIKENQQKKKVIKKIAKAITQYTESNSLYKNKIDLFLMKDFTKDSLDITNELFDLNYYAFQIEPNMKLFIPKEWKNFDDYLASFKTKFRVKAKKAISLSSPLKVIEVTNDNIVELLPEITSLYKTVTSKASFNLGKFDLRMYIDFKKYFKDNYFLKTYWLDKKMVGFMSGIINQKTIDAHFVGIDYQFNRSHAIYQRMLYDYVDLGIKNKVSILNFGRTASEIKSSIGAIPEDLTIYIRHKKSVTNKILKLFLLRIQPSEFNQKFPFKSVKHIHENN
ncbi:MAG: GNAT family N-acetyltransferase [Flavobacteriaceae bacterium]|nr:GNAT family N-acetyltransferase [Flavobacteriaceae bacterium]